MRILIFLFLLANCGFEPLYSNKSISEELNKIKVANIGTEIGHLLKANIEDAIYSKKEDYKYVLNVNVKYSELPLAIQQDREITRYRLILEARYVLKDSFGNKLSDGVIRREASFNAVTSEYATFVSKKDSKKRLVEEVAEIFKTKLAIELNRSL